MKVGVVIARKAIMPPAGVLRAQNGRGDVFPFKFRRLLGACLTGPSFSATDAGCFSGFLMVQPGSPVSLIGPQRSERVKRVGAFESPLHTPTPSYF